MYSARCIDSYWNSDIIKYIFKRHFKNKISKKKITLVSNYKFNEFINFYNNYLLSIKIKYNTKSLEHTRRLVGCNSYLKVTLTIISS